MAAGLPALAVTGLGVAGLVAAGFAAAVALAFGFADAAFTETAFVALTETGWAFVAVVLVAACALVETFTTDVLAAAFALDDFDFFSTLAPPKAAAQPSV